MVVNVKNSLQHNGTSLHWHGVRQYMTNGKRTGLHKVLSFVLSAYVIPRYGWHERLD